MYKPGPDESIGKCYTYDVLTAICIEVGFTVDPDTSEERWEYRGGCFENDSPVLMEKAVPGKVYEFDYVPIEVRADDDPYTAVSKEGGLEGGIDFSYFSWLGSLCFEFALIGSVVFIVSFAVLRKNS